MTRAEERALEAYPVRQQSGGCDVNRIQRKRFQEGYERAEKDLAQFSTENHIGSDDLMKAAEQYSQNILAGGEDMFDAIADGFIAGAKWLEEQMKKNSVDGHCFVSPVDPSVLFVQTDFFENKKNMKYGQTCKVIVLKSHEI